MANEKRSVKSGKFAVNPNSKRQQKLREKQMAEARARGETVSTVGDTAKPVENAANGAPQTAPQAPQTPPVTAGPAEPSHTEEWFSQPAKPKEPEVLNPDPDFDDDDDDGETIHTDTEPKISSRGKRKRAAHLAKMLIDLTDKTYSGYVSIRHPWLDQFLTNLPKEQAEMMANLRGLSEAERSILEQSLARYIEENNIEMSPGTELALFFGTMYVGRIVALEGLRAKMKGGI